MVEFQELRSRGLLQKESVHAISGNEGVMTECLQLILTFLDLNMIVCIKEAFGRQSRLDEVIRVWPLR